MVGKHKVLAETIIYLMYIYRQPAMTGDGWEHLINYLDFGRRVVGKEGNSEARLSQADHTTGREFRGLHLFRDPNISEY